jgi:hypothetical protein
MFKFKLLREVKKKTHKNGTGGVPGYQKEQFNKKKSRPKNLALLSLKYNFKKWYCIDVGEHRKTCNAL